MVVAPTLLCRLYCWFSISLWCHNSLIFVCYYVYICLKFWYVCLKCYLVIVCSCLVTYVDSWCHILHKTVANSYLVSNEDFGKNWFLGTVSEILCYHRFEVCFHFDTSEIQLRQKDIKAFYQFNVRVSWLKIIDKTARNSKFQESCFSLSENLLVYLFI